jgi:hypothetical protein
MKFTNILFSSAIASTILAYPGTGKWKQTLAELQRRAATPIDSPEDSNELLGDLITPGPTTPVGKVCLLKTSFNVYGLTLNSSSQTCLWAMPTHSVARSSWPPQHLWAVMLARKTHAALGNMLQMKCLPSSKVNLSAATTLRVVPSA